MDSDKAHYIDVALDQRTNPLDKDIAFGSKNHCVKKKYLTYSCSNMDSDKVHYINVALDQSTNLLGKDIAFESKNHCVKVSIKNMLYNSGLLDLQTFLFPNM
ncbi:hypothetical protein TcasGA2_TC007379 [Tribolium castaneum]|uniref:Uncharacterized protein n=1 Tax=Tribolium castaneum TaxID=7070 RepID=D1ZZY1_TRICA|nr:hypothetical protein TcasGA2_TC007379 [Tribolium castaneum]